MAKAAALHFKQALHYVTQTSCCASKLGRMMKKSPESFEGQQAEILTVTFSFSIDQIQALLHTVFVSLLNQRHSCMIQCDLYQGHCWVAEPMYFQLYCDTFEIAPNTFLYQKCWSCVKHGRQTVSPVTGTLVSSYFSAPGFGAFFSRLRGSNLMIIASC